MYMYIITIFLKTAMNFRENKSEGIWVILGEWKGKGKLYNIIFNFEIIQKIICI